MSDLISRQAAINAFRSLFEDYISQFRIDTILKNLPSAGPKRKMGKWIQRSSDEWYCSECEYDILTEGSWKLPKDLGFNFCPNCGADMRGE